MNSVKWTSLLLLAPLLHGCTSSPTVLPDGTAVLEGYVVYEGLDAVSPGDVVEVMLVNVSDPDIPDAVASDRIDDPDEGPVPFDIIFQVQGLEAGNAYALCARALDASGDTLWHTAEPVPVSPPTDRKIEVYVTLEDWKWQACPEWDDEL